MTFKDSFEYVKKADLPAFMIGTLLSFALFTVIGHASDALAAVSLLLLVGVMGYQLMRK